MNGENPGVPTNSYTFAKVHKDEVALAGYLGFTSTTWLRKLFFAWPVIKAFQEFGPVSRGLQKGGVYQMIKNSEVSILNADPDELLPRDENPADAGDENTHQAPLAERQRYVAWILLHLEADLTQYALSDESTNRRLNEEHLPLARQVYHKVPSCLIVAPAPFMSLLQGEHRLERINRCWNLLKHIGFLHTKGLWDTRVGSEEAIQDGEPVMVSELRKWMQGPLGSA